MNQIIQIINFYYEILRNRVILRFSEFLILKTHNSKLKIYNSKQQFALRLLVIIILCFVAPVASYSAIFVTGSNIYVTGTETGNSLRTEISGNPAAGTVLDRNIIFNRNLRVYGTLTDNNSVYHFTGSRGFFPNGGVVNFTDVEIIYEGTQKGYGQSQPFTANWERVSFVQRITTGRSDFFNNGDYSFDFKDVTLVSYGTGDYLHFQSSNTVHDIRIISPSGLLSFEPGAQNNGETQLVINLQLRGVNKIVGGLNSLGDFRVENLDWDKLNWRFNNRSVDIVLVNPIKPSGWINYEADVAGGCSRVKEYFTHNVTVLDVQRTPRDNVVVNLFNENETVFDYRLQTDSEGKIPAQEILKTDNSVYLNYNRGTWKLIVAEYNKEYFVRTREFNNKVDEEVILLNDSYVSETDPIVVSAYGTIDDANKFYDRAKFWKVQDANIDVPHIESLLLDKIGNALIMPTEWDLIVDPSGVVFNVDVANKIITINSSKLASTEKFNRLICYGQITLINDAIIDFPYQDATTDSYVRVIGQADTDTINFREFGSNNLIKKFVGGCGYAYSSQNDKLVVELKKYNGDSEMKYYDMNNYGLDNEFRVGVNEISLETMFTPTDRYKMYLLVDSLQSKMENHRGELNEVVIWLRNLMTKVQSKAP